MKRTNMKFVHTTLAAAVVLTASSAHAAVIQVTGHNHDIIAEAGNGAITSVTTSGVVNGLFTLAESGYTGVAGQTGTPLTITNDTVTSHSGTVYSVDPDANNTLIGDGTLTLSSPGQYQDLQFLLYFVGGDYEVTLNFADASTGVYSVNGVLDWQGSLGTAGPVVNDAFVTGKTSAPRRDNSTYFSQGLHMREVSFTLSAGDQAKTIDSITINYSAADDRSSTLAVSGTLVPEPSSTALIGLGGLALILRRRK